MLRTARFFAIALLASFLAASPSLALPPRAESIGARQVGFEGWTIQLFRGLWAFVTKEGGAADPHGASATSQSKEGGAMDPHGACATSPGCGQQTTGEEGPIAGPLSGGQDDK
jgi:hypothetical protein